MDFGIALATTVDAWRWVKRAEELGFSHAWFYDTQMLCADPFVAMALAAVNTDRIRLGTGVLIPSNRIAPVAANGQPPFHVHTDLLDERLRLRARNEHAGLDVEYHVVKSGLPDQELQWKSARAPAHQGRQLFTQFGRPGESQVFAVACQSLLKHEVIAEVMEDYISLKKRFGGS